MVKYAPQSRRLVSVLRRASRRGAAARGSRALAAGAIALGLAVFVAPDDAHADGAKVCTGVTSDLSAAGTDCAKAVAVLEALAAKPADVVAMTDHYQADAGCKKALDDALGGLMSTCNEQLFPALAKVSDADTLGRMSDASGVVKLLGEKLSFYHATEQVDPDDPTRTFTGVYPLAETQVCSSDADAAVWDELSFDPAVTNFAVCYQSSADRRDYALAVNDGSSIHCVRASSSKANKVGSMAECGPSTQTAAADPTPATAKPKPKVDSKPKTKPKPKIRKKKKAAKPNVSDVEALCNYWTDSVERFPKCDALGKRMYRKARDTPWKLRDVPRNGSYDAALAICTQAAKASSKCALDKEFKRAMERLGN